MLLTESRRAFDELKTSQAGTLKDFLKETSCKQIEFVCEDSGLALDLDTPEDYQRASTECSGVSQSVADPRK